MKKWLLPIYDLNGTLIKDLPIGYGSVQEIFKKFAPEVKPPTLEDYRETITSDYTKFYYDNGVSKEVSGPELNSIRAPYYRKRFGDIVLNDGAIELLQFCKEQGMHNTMVSAASEEAEDIMKELGIWNLFDSIKLKAWPKYEALIETVKLFNMRPEECFYLDDTADGVELAKQLGIGTIGFADGYNSKRRITQAKPDFVIDSLFEAIDILKSAD